MPTLRRPDHAPRLELTPLIDVIFLLLTFFIYNLLISVPMKELPLRLTGGRTGVQAGGGDLSWLRVDKHGNVFFHQNRSETRLTLEDLDARLTAFAADPARPTLYLQVDADGQSDRAPVIVDLLARVTRAGIKNFTLVGAEGKAPPSPKP
jgi:biopolymer transport protein ExbD